MSQHITNEELISYAVGELSEDRIGTVEAYLSDNPKARRLVHQYNAVVQITSSDDSIDPSLESIQKAKSIWQEQPIAKSSWLTLLDTFIADLIFDSRVHRAAVRGASTAVELEFRTSTFDLTVRLEQSPIGEELPWVLSGQVEFLDSTSRQAVISVRRADNGDEVVNTITDENGFFSVTGNPDHLEVLIGVDDQWTHLPGVDLS